MTTVTDRTTHMLEVPGAVLTYDVRRNDAGSEPALVLIGSPMGAAGFGTLAGYFGDRTVVTYDPRGVERSRRTDGAATTTPEEHADDLSRLIAALDAGPVDLFASSGGAVNALALVAAHPALLGQNLVPCTHYEPDVEALRSASTRVVLAAGAESDGELAHRGAHAVAERLGTTPVTFPGGHNGFLGGEYGQTGEPEAFAVRLREVLAAPAG